MKIKSKKIIKVEEPVYDITVPEHHNFLLDAGIFVHNCDHPQTVIGGWKKEDAGKTMDGSKDVADATCACIYKAFSSPVQTNIIEIANAIDNSRAMQMTSQAKPLRYNVPKQRMTQRQAVQMAMKLFNKR